MRCAPLAHVFKIVRLRRALRFLISNETKGVGMKDSIIHTDNVRFSYVTAEGVAPLVLDGVTLSIAEGSFVAVLGAQRQRQIHPG